MRGRSEDEESIVTFDAWEALKTIDEYASRKGLSRHDAIVKMRRKRGAQADINGHEADDSDALDESLAVSTADGIWDTYSLDSDEESWGDTIAGDLKDRIDKNILVQEKRRKSASAMNRNKPILSQNSDRQESTSVWDKFCRFDCSSACSSPKSAESYSEEQLLEGSLSPGRNQRVIDDSLRDPGRTSLQKRYDRESDKGSVDGESGEISVGFHSSKAVRRSYKFHGEVQLINSYSRHEESDDPLAGWVSCAYENGMFEGEIKDGKRHGLGTFHFTDGDTYHGGFVEGRIEGLGSYQYSDGGLYQGQFRNDRREGKGRYLFTNGDTYEGEYLNNAREGKGVFRSVSGNVFKGMWKNDIREGHGRFRWANGAKFYGTWRNNLKDGTGTYVTPNGVEFFEEWRGGKLVARREAAQFYV